MAERWTALIPLIGLGVACSQIHTNETLSFSSPVEAISITSDAGVIEVVRGEALSVERTIRGPEGGVEVADEQAGGELSLTATCATVMPCAVDLRVFVPEGVAVDIKLDRGEVWATGVDDLQLELDEGAADLSTAGRLVAQVGKGTVRAALGEGSDATITVGVGDVEVQAEGRSWRTDVQAAEATVPEMGEVATGSLRVFAPTGRANVAVLTPAS